jgi:cell wall assembly regulator SMI1
MSDIERLWSRLEVWAGANAPELLSDLNPGATTDQVQLLESELGVTLPDAFKASLALHNGENDGWPCKAFVDRGAYLSTSRIVEEWRQRQQFGEDIEEDPAELIQQDVITVEGPVQPRMFLTRWVPFLECNGDVFWAMDFSPVEGGTQGQIIEVDWECCSWKVVADSFAGFFENYVLELERGELTASIAASANEQEMVQKHKAVLWYKLAFGSIVSLFGLMLIWGSSGPVRLSAGLLLLVWGGLIIGAGFKGRNSE